MNSSFSFRRLGVIRRISRPRWAVCLGGSNAGSWSPKGSSSRYVSMISVMSSPSSGTGNLAKGPIAELQFEKLAWSW